MNELCLAITAYILFFVLDLIAVAARTGYSQLTHARLLAIREQWGSKVNPTLNLLPMFSRIRASLNLALVASRFLLAGLTMVIVFLQPVSYPLWVTLLTLMVSALLIFWMEWVTEKVVSKAPDVWAIKLTPYVRVISLMVWLFLIPIKLPSEVHTDEKTSGSVTEDELKTLVDAGQEEGVFELGERRMIYSIFQLGDTLAREIMVPRIDMMVLDVNTPLLEAVDNLLYSGHSRVPVFEDTVDHLIGLLYAKDLLKVWREGRKSESIRDLLRPVYFVPEAKKADELLAEMQKQRIHMAVIVDEYGGVAGLVTLEDIVEEIVGEIQDEYDQGEEAPYQKLADGSYSFQGRIDMDDFNEMMNSDLPRDDADTLGGYIYSRLGRVPTVGEKISSGNLLLTVEQVSAHRIRKVNAQRLPQGIQEEEKENDNQ